MSNRRVYGTADISCSNLHEIPDPETQIAFARAIGLYVALCAADDPRKKVETAGGGGNRESTPPGREACPGKVEHARKLVANLAQQLENTLAATAATVVNREAAHVPVESVGGVRTLDVDATGRGFVARRNNRDADGRFTPGVVRAHLEEKLRKAVE